MHNLVCEYCDTADAFQHLQQLVVTKDDGISGFDQWKCLVCGHTSEVETWILCALCSDFARHELVDSYVCDKHNSNALVILVNDMSISVMRIAKILGIDPLQHRTDGVLAEIERVCIQLVSAE